MQTKMYKVDAKIHIVDYVEAACEEEAKEKFLKYLSWDKNETELFDAQVKVLSSDD